jgi:hypothetical protein
MRALTAGERYRYDELRPQVLHAVDQVEETPTGFRLRVGSSVSVADVAESMAMEHRCCAFLTLDLSLTSVGTTWIEIGGSTAIKAFVKAEFSSIFRGST